MYSVLSDNLDLAASAFCTLNQKIDELELETFEPNMVYLIKSNYAGYLHVVGRSDEGRKIWQSLEETVRKIPYTSAAYFIKKHELMWSAFDDVPTGNGVAWDTHLTTTGRREVGPSWDNYARGFRMPEIEFWRDA